jgi:hypothetical protein
MEPSLATIILRVSSLKFDVQCSCGPTYMAAVKKKGDMCKIKKKFKKKFRKIL